MWTVRVVCDQCGFARETSLDEFERENRCWYNLNSGAAGLTRDFCCHKCLVDYLQSKEGDTNE